MSNNLPELKLTGSDIDYVEVYDSYVWVHLNDGRTLVIGVSEAHGMGIMTRGWVEVGE